MCAKWDGGNVTFGMGYEAWGMRGRCATADAKRPLMHGV